MLTGSIETLFYTCDTDLLLAIELKRADEQFMNKVTINQEFWYWYFVFFNDFAEAELKKKCFSSQKEETQWNKRKERTQLAPKSCSESY